MRRLLARSLARLRAWWRPPRRLRLQLGGGVLIAGVFALGVATLNTGNNLLYLLVGALLGLIALSGWLSEQSISGIRVERRLPGAVTAGQRARITYHVHNRKPRLASVSLLLAERDVQRGSAPAPLDVEPASVLLVEAGGRAAATGSVVPPRRGLYRLERLVVSTTYPFGLFIKERDVRLGATLRVWPRTDRPVRAVQAGGRYGARLHAGAGAAAGAERGEFRGLRPYRPGDDPRDVHWRSLARLREPVVREYDRDASDTWWIVLDPAAADPAVEEVAVELAAALAARAARRGDRFGFAAGTARIPPSTAPGQLEAVLDVLAAVEFRAGAALQLPAPAAECVLVTARGASADGFADVVRARREDA